MDEKLSSPNSYTTFKDQGNMPYLYGYKKIIVHFVFAVKHQLRHKARLVTGDYLSHPDIEGTFSSFVQLRSTNLSVFAVSRD